MIDFNLELEEGYDDDLKGLSIEFVDKFIEDVFG